MPRTPVKTPPITPTRRSTRINERKAVELASATPGELAKRIVQLESNYEELTVQVSNLSLGIESQLPEMTVALLTDGVETHKDELSELKDELILAMDELRKSKQLMVTANNESALSRRREMEYMARIDQLKSEKQTLKDATAKLRSTRHRLEQEQEASLDQMKHLKDRFDTEAKKRADLVVKVSVTRFFFSTEQLFTSLTISFFYVQYNALCEEYNKSVTLLEPIFRKMTPTKSQKGKQSKE